MLQPVSEEAMRAATASRTARVLRLENTGRHATGASAATRPATQLTRLQFMATDPAQVQGDMC
jgi:hypothetical protein